MSQNAAATTAATTTNARPRSPATHFVNSRSLVNGEKIDCSQRLWLACRKIGGQTLSVSNRSHACAKLIAIATNVNVNSQNHGGRPASR